MPVEWPRPREESSDDQPETHQVIPGRARSESAITQHNPGWAQREELEELGKDVIKGRAGNGLAILAGALRTSTIQHT